MYCIVLVFPASISEAATYHGEEEDEEETPPSVPRPPSPPPASKSWTVDVGTSYIRGGGTINVTQLNNSSNQQQQQQEQQPDIEMDAGDGINHPVFMSNPSYEEDSDEDGNDEKKD